MFPLLHKKTYILSKKKHIALVIKKKFVNNNFKTFFWHLSGFVPENNFM